MKRYWMACISIAILIGFDRWTKFLAVVRLKDQPSIPIIPNIFELTYVENRGAAFGVLQDQRWFFLILTFFVLVLLIYAFVRVPSGRRFVPLQMIGIGFFSGAAGNMIDRMLHGYVVDFLYFRLIDFPVFNLADVYVTVTAVFFFLFVFFFYKDEEFEFLKLRRKDRKKKEEG
jgi:signal peptidase II